MVANPNKSDKSFNGSSVVVGFSFYYLPGREKPETFKPCFWIFAALINFLWGLISKSPDKRESRERERERENPPFLKHL